LSTGEDKEPPKVKRIDLGSDPIPKVFVSYALPSVLGLFVMTSATIVDGIFVGRFVGPHALASINLIVPLVLVLSGIAAMIGTGGATVSNIRRGARHLLEANRLYTLTLLLLAGFGFGILLVGRADLGTISDVLGADESVSYLVTDYLGVILLFAPFFMLTFAEDLFIRGDGHPVFPAAILIGGSLTNIVLDYYFIAVLGWGIKGAAWATGASQVVPFLLLLAFLVRRSTWCFTWPRVAASSVVRLMYNGLSEFVDQASFGVSHYIFNLVLMARIGALGVAAYSIAGYTVQLVGVLFFGIAQAIHPAVSFNIGAGNVERVRRFRNVAFGANAVIGFLGFLFLQLLRGPIAGFFVTDPGVVALASEISYYFSFALLAAGLNIAAATYFTALDRPTESALIALSRSLIVLLIGLLTLPLLFGLTGIWLSFCLAEFATLVLVAYLVKNKGIRLPQLAQ